MVQAFIVVLDCQREKLRHMKESSGPRVTLWGARCRSNTGPIHYTVFRNLLRSYLISELDYIIVLGNVSQRPNSSWMEQPPMCIPTGFMYNTKLILARTIGN